MKHWTQDWLSHASGQHIASESGLRVQIIDVPDRLATYWEIPKGQLLVVALRGTFTVDVEGHGNTILDPLDQVLLEQGERFRLHRPPDSGPALAELIWTPGISGG